MALPDLAPLAALAGAMADAAGEIARGYFRQPVAIEDKADATPVTRADRESERAIRRLVAEHHPTHGVIGEEEGPERPEAEFVWVIDPLDGTKRFITGNPMFGCLIALLHEGRPVLGVIDMPVLGERWVGVAGQPTLFRDAQGDREVRARPCATLDQATLSAASPHMFSDHELPAFERVRKAVKTPLYGGDCFNYGALASGFMDLVIEADMGLYDYMAVIPVVTGAGGLVTDWRGQTLGLEGATGRVLAAGDPKVHEAALALLALD
ncbi:MAG: histidinol-phosphatase [Pseudomonadota bacterium]